MENKEVIAADSIPLLQKEDGFGERVKNSVVLKTVTFGANGLFFAGHLVLNGKYLSYLGAGGPGASSIMSTSPETA